MANLDVLLAFALATLTFAAFPGPAILYTAAQTLVRGRRAGFMAVLGIHLGCYVHVFAAVFGLSAMLKHVPEAYAALKIAGAIYLVWLGIGMIRAKLATGTLPEVERRSAKRAFIESIVVELTNPKVAIFFIAFLPQFVDPAASLPVWAQFLILGVIVNCAFSLADIITVLLASRVASGLRRSNRAQTAIRWTGGTILAGLGLRLALERN